jgi:hypothetical protein
MMAFNVSSMPFWSSVSGGKATFYGTGAATGAVVGAATGGYTTVLSTTGAATGTGAGSGTTTGGFGFGLAFCVIATTKSPSLRLYDAAVFSSLSKTFPYAINFKVSAAIA